jgi:hypothetical protein
MRNFLPIVLLIIVLSSCKDKTGTTATGEVSMPIVGTWQLVTGTLIEKGDTVVTDYTKKLSFIKIINQTHFSFLMHDLAGGKDSSAAFGAGGGSYTLKDSTYTEHLEYCNDRAWEGHDFTFTLTLQNDTLTQRGMEKVAATGVDRLNIERYVRVKNK